MNERTSKGICDVLDGKLTLFLEDVLRRRQLESIIEDDIAKHTVSIIKENMNNGTFNNAHAAIIDLNFIDLDHTDHRPVI